MTGGTRTELRNPRREWAAVNVRLLWKHRHVHPIVRTAIRNWIEYARFDPDAAVEDASSPYGYRHITPTTEART